jgi:hypothetical protein
MELLRLCTIVRKAVAEHLDIFSSDIVS